MNLITDKDLIRDEFQSLTRMAKECRQPQLTGILGQMMDSQYKALCLGGMQALAWILGESAPPTISINEKLREINEQ